MKKIFTIMLALSSIYFTAFAQKTNPIEFGIDIGSNRSTTNVQQSSSYGNQSGALYGFNIGFSAEYYFSAKWGIKGKVIYDQKGWADGSTISRDGSEIEVGDFRLNYITIPVMANWHFSKKRNWYLNFGPYVGFLLKAKIGSKDFDIANNPYSSTDFGGTVGLGVKIPLSNKAKLFFEIEGQHGLENINNDGSILKFYNTRSSLNVGINF